jgi:hypothetical protein
MLSFLLALASLSFGRADSVAFYLALTLGSASAVGVLMRRDLRRRRAEEARLPAAVRPSRRVPRLPITFPVLETALIFAFWYVVAIATDRLVTGTTNVFTLIAIAPFAAFMLAALTIAGRHMAFRLTAEDVNDGTGAKPDRREGGDVGGGGDDLAARSGGARATDQRRARR